VRRSYSTSDVADSGTVASDDSEMEEVAVEHAILYCDVLEADVELATRDPFGQVKGGHLQLAGRLARAEFSPSRSSRKLHRYLTLPSHKNRRKEIKVKPQWDEERYGFPTFQQTQDFFLLLVRSQIMKDDYKVLSCSGLILEPVPDAWKFRRIDMFKWPNRDLDELELEPVKIEYFFNSFYHAWCNFDDSDLGENLEKAPHVEFKRLREMEEMRRQRGWHHSLCRGPSRIRATVPDATLGKLSPTRLI